MLKVFDVRQKKKPSVNTLAHGIVTADYTSFCYLINKKPIQYINKSALKKASAELGVSAMI